MVIRVEQKPQIPTFGLRHFELHQSILQSNFYVGGNMDAQETSIYNAILISGVILGLIIIYFIISIVRHQRKNIELYRKSVLAEITVLEKERARIAADLHDELGPMLSSIKMKINSFELTDEIDKKQVLKTSKHIDDLLKNIRNISFDLMPSALLRKGLVFAVKAFVDYLDNNNATKFIFECNQSIEVNEQMAINIYRIIQESTNNAIKHANATEVRIQMTQHANVLKVNVIDNGIGFNTQKQMKESTGFGLRSLASRTEIIKGRMFLESNPGKGTSFSFEIPI